MKMIPREIFRRLRSSPRPPVGTGPYKLDAFNRGQDIVLVANPDYWGGRRAIDKVTYRFVGESGTRPSGLVAGEFDVITNLPARVRRERAEVGGGAGAWRLRSIILSTDNEVTKDPRVRRGDEHRHRPPKALADSLFGGYGAAGPAASSSTPKAFGFNEALAGLSLRSGKGQGADHRRPGAEEQDHQPRSSEAGRWLKDTPS